MSCESFENTAIAAWMNDHFIPIKANREEHPDIDWIYQHALALTGEQGPLMMFLNPNGKPCWGGTYFSSHARYGRPSFENILREIIQSCSAHSDRIAHNIEALRKGLQFLVVTAPVPLPSPEVKRPIALKLLDAMDGQYGGLASAPKFPQISLFDFLWQHGLKKTSLKDPRTEPKPTASN